MKRVLTSAALAAVALAGPARGQQPVATTQPYTVYRQPYAYAQPGTTYYAQPRDSRAVLPSFSQRGGIGTTPFLGNTRGLGGFSVNYDAVPQSSYTYPARSRRWFRRNR